MKLAFSAQLTPSCEWLCTILWIPSWNCGWNTKVMRATDWNWANSPLIHCSLANDGILRSLQVFDGDGVERNYPSFVRAQFRKFTVKFTVPSCFQTVRVHSVGRREESDRVARRHAGRRSSRLVFAGTSELRFTLNYLFPSSSNRESLCQPKGTGTRSVARASASGTLRGSTAIL